ncbi:heavy-metal-associated domain-containing protein [Gudongella oleilytica]|mgnify:FL=1|uniref:heavy-metal-associated domain-containing protein n=1 Tax=Gudongella oleilytica TaxID=1582259 RepID=UPI000FF8A57C|nr:copper ion binding protein [Gudongella oleilytica]MDY0257170.1 copper ion binding protein [Gudongella oleilytica]HMM69869.1 copper ion binding protein [Gudongella oleilytica]
MEKILKVEGMSCNHCVMAVKRALTGLDGVGTVEVDLESGKVTVVGEALADEALREAIDDAGYEVVSIE